MPHLVVEYSRNLPDAELNPAALLHALCNAAVGTGLFPQTGLRARAHGVDHFVVATGEPDKAFVHVGMMVGKGRTEEARSEAGARIFETLKTYMAPLMAERVVLLSFEMRELDPVKFNFKNL